MAAVSRFAVAPIAPAAEVRPVWLSWVTAARAGDPQAFQALHRHFGKLVHAVIIARAPAGDVADLVQEVFLLVFQRLPQLEDPQAFPAWLTQLARHRVARHLRDRRPEEPLDGAPHPSAPDHSAAPDARRILAALHALPEAYAETLAMRLVEGMTGPEIAERTGLTPGSVRVNLHRGMALLRAQLGVPSRPEAVDE